MADKDTTEQKNPLLSVADILANLLAESEESTESLSRVERKRRNTRGKIISATEQLIESRPLDELTIAEITHAADVGHGTFYLHFKSKYELAVPIIFQHTLEWDQTLQPLISKIADPAGAVAFSGRHMARLIVADPLWRWFLQESGVPTDDVRAILGRFVIRDIEKGFESGRFQAPEPELAMNFVFGGVVSVLSMIVEASEPNLHIDQAIELMLRTLGVPIDEAKKIAHRPLKPL